MRKHLGSWVVAFLLGMMWVPFVVSAQVAVTPPTDATAAAAGATGIALTVATWLGGALFVLVSGIAIKEGKLLIQGSHDPINLHPSTSAKVNEAASLIANSARAVFFHSFTVDQLEDLRKFLPGKSAAEIAAYLAANFEDKLIEAVKDEAGALAQKEWLVLKGGDQTAVDAQITRALAVTAPEAVTEKGQQALDLKEVGDGLAAISGGPSTPAQAAPVERAQ